LRIVQLDEPSPLHGLAEKSSKRYKIVSTSLHDQKVCNWYETNTSAYAMNSQNNSARGA